MCTWTMLVVRSSFNTVACPSSLFNRSQAYMLATVLLRADLQHIPGAEGIQASLGQYHTTMRAEASIGRW